MYIFNFKINRMIKRCLTFFLLAVLVLPTFSQNTQKVGDFIGLSVSGNLIVTLIPTNGDLKVIYDVIKGDEEDFEIQVVDKTLRLKIKNTYGRSRTKVEAKVYYKAINTISVSAGSSLSNEQILKTEYLTLSASSGSNTRLSVSSNAMTVSASSGTSVQLSGNGGSGTMSASSGASINAKELIFDDLTVSSSSGASISAHVKDAITASASSGGSISYKGDPKSVTKSKSSSGGSVSKI